MRIKEEFRSMKLFLKRPPEMQDTLGMLLQQVINENYDVHVRDRGLLYYELLKAGPEKADSVINSSKDEKISGFAVRLRSAADRDE